jgi:ankyrin repeat protein
LNKNILYKSLLEDTYNNFVKKLFDYSTIINKINNDGENILHFSVFYGMIDKYYALINIGADISITKEHNSLLHYACFSGKDDFLIMELIKLGLFPDLKNLNNETCVHFCSNQRIAHYLNLWCLRNNIKIESLLDKNGNTVAHTSNMYGFRDSANYWINNYPKLVTVKNDNNLVWNETKLFNKKFCKGF